MRRRPCGVTRALALAALVAWAPGCTDTPQSAFERDALPALESRCATAACHGVAVGEGFPSQDWLFFRLDELGRIADPVAAREMALSRVTTSAPALSTLVRTPMPGWADGGPHAGGSLYTGPDDPHVQGVLRWIATEEPGSGGEDLVLDEREQLFANTVLPVLVERCARDGCHGPTAVAFTAFAARPELETGRFAPEEIRATYRAARKHLDLWGADPAGSRLVRKALGAVAGGLVHRGSDGTFFPEAPPDRPLDAPGLAAMLAWARAEREALGVIDGQVPSAMLYVRGEPAPRAPYRIAEGPLGSDLYRTAWPVVADAEENLSAALHPDGSAEVRDPAVSHDGTRVVFAMRLESEARFSLWEMELASRATRRVTPIDASGSFVQPTYAADGRIAAVWDGHGGVGTDGDGVPPELVALDEAGVVERLTFTPAPEMSPAMLSAGKTRGVLVFGTRRRRGDDETEGVLFRFPLCHDADRHGEPEYHVQFGASMAPLAPLVARDLPDGRQVMIVLAHTEVGDDRGRLALLDRALGPLVPDEDLGSVSLGGYRPPVSYLDAEARWRDPAPLPDGTFLAVRDDPASPGEDAIVQVRVRDGLDGSSLASVTPVLAEPGRSLRSPVAVFARPREDDDHEPVIDPTLEQAYITFRDVAVLEALYGRAEPRGERVLREDIRGIRLLEWVGAPEDGFARYADGGTSAGLTDRAPAAVLFEHELPEDRSAWIEIPARTPLLLQWIDARGMVVGNQLDRWFFGEGAESVPGGTNSSTYAHNCAGCHGATSGRPEDAAAPQPDAISSASINLSSHRNRDRRQPLSPRVTPTEGVLIDYVGVVGPLFEARCVECHGGSDPAAGLALDSRAGADRFPSAYEELLTRFVDRTSARARRSGLVERLLGEELDAPSPVTGLCPPGGADDALVRTVAQWIESGALFDAAARERP